MTSSAPDSPRSESPTHVVQEPFHYLMNNTRGKDFRSKLIDAFNIWFQIPEDRLNICKQIVSKLHNASLLIDDIEDNSKLRRGKPCAHLIYGVAATINSANYVYFEALQDCMQLQNQRTVQIFMDELLQLHKGQAMDIHWRDNIICPSEEEYLEMVKNKTGGLFRLAVGLMQSQSAVETNFLPLVNDLSALFQILDDYLNLASSTYHTNKSFCEDLTEGKFSFPIIHSIQNAQSKDKQLLNILRQRTTDEGLKRYAVELMQETKSFDYTLNIMRAVESRVFDHIRTLGGNPMLEGIVRALMAQIGSQ